MNDYPETTAPAVEAALSKQGKNITVLDMRELVGYTDFFMLVSAESELQIKAITEEITERMKKKGSVPLHAEGSGNTGWVLLDYGELLIHVFLPEVRDFYGLEKLWSDAPSKRFKE